MAGTDRENGESKVKDESRGAVEGKMEKRWDKKDIERE